MQHKSPEQLDKEDWERWEKAMERLKNLISYQKQLEKFYEAENFLKGHKKKRRKVIVNKWDIL